MRARFTTASASAKLPGLRASINDGDPAWVLFRNGTPAFVMYAVIMHGTWLKLDYFLHQKGHCPTKGHFPVMKRVPAPRNNGKLGDNLETAEFDCSPATCVNENF
jgi:hypothetical protein